MVALIKAASEDAYRGESITRPVRLKKSLVECVMRRNRKAPQSAAVVAPNAIKAAATTENVKMGVPVYLVNHCYSERSANARPECAHLAEDALPDFDARMMAYCRYVARRYPGKQDYAAAQHTGNRTGENQMAASVESFSSDAEDRPAFSLAANREN